MKKLKLIRFKRRMIKKEFLDLQESPKNKINGRKDRKFVETFTCS